MFGSGKVWGLRECLVAREELGELLIRGLVVPWYDEYVTIRVGFVS